MHWPGTPVERLQAFRPSFCPHPECTEHQRTERGLRFRRHGFYRTLRRWRIPRFVCPTCRHTFSRQSFALSYFLKRPELLVPVAAGLQAGSAHRQIARTVGCAPSTVTGLSARLGRHALLLHGRALNELRGRTAEPFVLDHFEVFEFSQDYPFGVATVVGAKSWFWYLLDPAPHRRTGHISAFQTIRLARRPSRPRFGGYVGSAARVFDRMVALVPSPGMVEVRCDDHPAYRRVATAHAQRWRLSLRRFRNPERGPKGSPRSAEARARDQAMFPVDALHQLLRHTGAHYRRETIAFGRRLNAVMERLYLTAVWRNFVKGVSENNPSRGTPAMQVGLTSQRWSWKRILSRRLFPNREKVPELCQILYRREWPTPLLQSNRLHHLKYAQ
jgi:transposase-like protein